MISQCTGSADGETNIVFQAVKHGGKNNTQSHVEGSVPPGIKAHFIIIPIGLYDRRSWFRLIVVIVEGAVLGEYGWENQQQQEQRQNNKRPNPLHK